MDCVRSHYVNTLNAPEFCSALQRRLNNKFTHQQLANDSFIVENFYHELSCLYADHSMMENKMKYMNENFSNELSSIAVSKKRCSVFFTTAAMICAAAAAIVAGNAILHMSPARTWIAAAAAAFSILFTAVGIWQQSVLKKDETAVKKHKQITDYMIMGARSMAWNISRLDFVSEKLSEMAYVGKIVAAVENSLKRKVEDYGEEMKWVKQHVLQSIIEIKVG